MPIEWIDTLRDALTKQFQRDAYVATFATTGADGSPRARCVVCRRVDDAGTLTFVSDARSDKNAQLSDNPMAAVVFWLDQLRVQFRVEGPVEIIGESSPDQTFRASVWRDLSDTARALFTWPAPGRVREANGDRFARTVSVDTPIPASFKLLKLSPALVERLVLTEHPHRRSRWRAPAWTIEELNP